MRLALLFLLSLCFSVAGFAQQTVSGVITDNVGEPVIGATVQVAGTTVGTITDIDGRYELTVPDGSTELQVSYIGFEGQRIPLTGASNYDLTMTEGVALDEIVVTGYSVGTKRDATGAISTIEADKLQAIPSSNIEQQLQGRAAGVTVITNGQPGTQSKVRIRGFGSFNANQPLYVVDGVPTQDVSFLVPDDIATTTILKDAASASIYGSRASSGVIVYTTKKGKKGEGVRISYDGLIGLTTPGTGQPILSPQQQADYTLIALRNARINAGKNPDTLYSHPQYGQGVTQFTVPDFLVDGDRRGVSESSVNLDTARAKYSESSVSPYLLIRSNKEGTDWYDEITKLAVFNRHTLGFTGGTDAGRFYFGLSAQDEKGTLLNAESSRYGFRANSEFNVGSRVRIGENIQMTYGSTLGLIGGSGGQNVAQEENDVLLAFRIAPTIPVYNEFGGYAGTRATGFGNPSNPVANREAQRDNTNRNLNAFGNVYAEVDIVKGLFARTLLGGRYGTYAGRAFGRRTYENAENNQNNSYSEYSGNSYNWVWTNTLNFNYTLGGNHNISGLVGYEALSLNNGYFTDSRGINPFSTNPDFVNLNQVQNPVVNSGFATPNAYASILSQVNYNYASKYYVTAVIRQDKSAGFSADVRRGVFPAISAAWRVTGEDFLQPGNVLSDLKIRAGYGVMGNADAVGPQNRFNLFGGNVGTSYYPITGSQGTAAPGSAQTQIGNPDAKWEQAISTNVGFDASFFRNKLDVIVDFWQRTNDDVLVRAQLSDNYGKANRPFTNVGSIDNRGIDLQVTYRDNITTDLSFEATVTGSFLKNRVDRLADNITFFEAGNVRSGNVARNLVGQPISSFFGYQVNGLWQSQAEIDAANATAGAGKIFQDGAAPGRLRYTDNNSVDENGKLTGRPDGIIDEADRTVLGSPIPDFTGGLNLRVAYKGFDIETFLYTSLGNEIFNFSKYYTDFYPVFPGAALSTRVLDSWTPQNQSNTQPIFENYAGFSSTDEITSFYVENGSYLRMRLLSLGYNLPRTALGGTFTRARVSVSANNLFTITGYKGLDPQVGGAADTNFGIDLGNFPVTRSFNFGLGLTF